MHSAAEDYASLFDFIFRLSVDGLLRMVRWNRKGEGGVLFF
jgi:hypothetical protein